MHDQAGAFWQEDRLSVLVIALPVKVPVPDPNQPPLFPAGEQSITLQVLAQIMSMRKDPQQIYIYGEHIGLLDDVVGCSGWYLEIEAGQLDSKRHIGRRLVSKIKPNRRLDGFRSARRMQVHLQDKVHVRLQHPGQTADRQRRHFARLPAQ